MRRYLGTIATFGIALLVLIALSLAGNVELYQEAESEAEPRRSSFNAGPTGTRAFYQLLEESGHRVSRWRERFRALKSQAPNGVLVMIGPFAGGLSDDDAEALQDWIQEGGHVFVISRLPQEQLDYAVYADTSGKVPDPKATAEQLVNAKSDELITQATRITHGLRGLALSDLASHIPLSDDKSETPTTDVTPQPSATAAATATPKPEPTQENEGNMTTQKADSLFVLLSPVVHLGDKKGAVLADYDYGKGRVIVLTDPFVIANHGLARGANLQLVQNLLRELNAAERPILFDEYHHGYRSETNALIGYFRGTPFWWVLGQLLLLTGLVIYGAGKRFARPLPLAQTDRHSPLEFVSSMASLQQAAEAHDLALENIYPKFRARLCRRLGLSVRAKTEEIVAALPNSPRFAPHAERLLRIVQTSEQSLNHQLTLTDNQVVELVRMMRELNDQKESATN
ncbi:MAG: DUF4350 domain-containing protein [Acidobacteria bacterium]|nr:DUF4350 domain-containing protein [Acidobacteriota bacterium]